LPQLLFYISKVNRLTNAAAQPKCFGIVDLLRAMKKIEAIIKPFKLGDVREALIEIGVEGVTVTEVKMLGRHADHTGMSRSGEYISEFLPKLKFEVVVADNRVNRTIRAIVGKARTGRINDGKVFVVPVQQAIRIRTGERGEAAV
jgi:nitrogen regulatory protein P-II 1